MTTSWPSLFRGIPPLLRANVPAHLGAFHCTATNWQTKAWSGNKSIHYEITVRHHAKVVELGLHFESDALTNARLIGAFRSRAKEVKRELGSGARLEEWDKGWSRVWEPLALEKVTPEYSEAIQRRFVDYVRALEPILRDELPVDVEWRIAAVKRIAARKPVAGMKRRTAAPRGARATSSRSSRSARR
ncbi:MAG TPA: hypothetical protein VM052_01985 [Candidatus Limnocylindrales bacterium]|nr:hypothetical protein [Candidatus Limnocylindrales bacterium]